MKREKSKFSFKSALAGVCTGFLNGCLGSGGGVILVLIFNNIIKVEEKKSHATTLSIILFLTMVSSVIYVSKGIYDFNLTWKVAIGSITGGIIGAKLLSKVTGEFLRLAFGTIMIIASIRLLFK